MLRDLPPLAALRAFEAAARNLSFTRAAQELFVTQAAVSHQIKRLEGHLGLALFRRLPRRLLLTDAGQRYFAAAREALDRLAEATARLRSEPRPDRLTVSVLSSFAAAFLVPRLARFRARHPEIEVWVSADDASVDFAREEVDLGIRYGRGRYPGLRTDLLIPGEVLPVCSPELARDLSSPAALARQTLIHDDVGPFADELIDWPKWLKAAGVEGIDAGKGPHFSHANLALDAARRGEGVLLIRRALVLDDLEAGRLVAPFALVLREGWAHYLVCPEGRAGLAKIAAFRGWLLAETARYREGAGAPEQTTSDVS
ncbi:MAG: transcriptional regulator GcvA [Proteobacteria bacterium]|nr:transcriptional regulator GcvA [Pseudomonadota bacterium]